MGNLLTGRGFGILPGHETTSFRNPGGHSCDVRVALPPGHREHRPTAAACRAEGREAAAQADAVRSGVLGLSESDMATLVRPTDLGYARDGRPLASCWIQEVLAVEVAQGEARASTHRSGGSPAHWPDGLRETGLGGRLAFTPRSLNSASSSRNGRLRGTCPSVGQGLMRSNGG